MPSKEHKNNHIEKALAKLLRQLKEAKIQQDNWGSGHFESLNDGIKALENIQFASIDDFQSVKELVEIKQFFSRSVALNRFYFPDYRPYINPVLLNYTEVEVQLDTLEMKALDLDCREHKLAAAEVKSLVLGLRNLNQWYFNDKKIDCDEYKTRALQIINDSRPVLEKHRGYKQILGNLILLILTVGTAFLIHKACTGHLLFFKQTDSAKQINALSEKIYTYPIQQP